MTPKSPNPSFSLLLLKNFLPKKKTTHFPIAEKTPDDKPAHVHTLPRHDNGRA